ncbi:MAG: DUF4097 family beta strand repeat protein [Candidatus Izimaplasma sp.]|nr:DUF4097 family beta strand repeat protein [Candidatus Izimaplasma bacterium]
MKKFLKELEMELKMLKMNNKDIDEILEDHKEMIDAAIDEGLNETEIEEKFGNPKNVAKELSKDTKESKKSVVINVENSDSCVKDNTSKYDLVEAFPVVSGKITVEIGLVSENLSITTYEGESIQVFQRGVKEIKEYDILFENNVLLLKKKAKIKLFNFSSNDAKFLVLVPSNVELDGFNYKSVSGDANINGILTTKFNIKNTSGDIEITNIVAKDIKVSAVSGEIVMTGFKGESFEISTISGDIEAEKGVISGSMYFHSVSGDIDVEEIECEEATLKTISGDLEGKEFYPKKITLKSISGDIIIRNSDESREIDVINKKTVSGDIVIS